VVGGLISAPPLAAADEPVVLTLAANGSRNTRPFTVKQHWEIRWDSTRGITVSAVRADADPTDPLATLPVASGAQFTPGKGSTYVESGGAYYLKIVAVGDWTVSVVQLP
jgi:hypothetical protein